MDEREPNAAEVQQWGLAAGTPDASLFIASNDARAGLPDVHQGRRRSSSRISSVQTPESNPSPMPSPSKWAGLAILSEHFRPTPAPGPRPDIPTTRPLTSAEETFRHSGWKHVRRQLRAAKEAAGASASNLEAWDRCGCNAWVWINAKTSDVKLRASFCKDRYCHPCAQLRGRRIARNLVDHLDQLKAREFLHVMLSTLHTDEPMRLQKRRLYKHFEKLRNSPFWKRYCPGGAFFFETTLSDSRQFHPHLHIIAESGRIPIEGLKELWCKITGGAYVVWIRKIESAHDAAMEVCKYVSKPIHPSVRRDPERLVELIKALRGGRLCATFGTWRGFKLADDNDPLDDPDDWKPCGSLDDVIKRARAGELAAAGLLKALADAQHAPISRKVAPAGLDSS